MTARQGPSSLLPPPASCSSTHPFVRQAIKNVDPNFDLPDPEDVKKPVPELEKVVKGFVSDTKQARATVLGR